MSSKEKVDFLYTVPQPTLCHAHRHSCRWTITLYVTHSPALILEEYMPYTAPLAVLRAPPATGERHNRVVFH